LHGGVLLSNRERLSSAVLINAAGTAASTEEAMGGIIHWW
jgi:hypothetical protein